jgi:excisionase family DNA binding protein
VDIVGPVFIAATLGVHPRTVRRWIAAGWLRGHRLGNRKSHLRVMACDLEALLRTSKARRLLMRETLRDPAGPMKDWTPGERAVWLAMYCNGRVLPDLRPRRRRKLG